MELDINMGERGVVIGQTGSGKTIGSIWLMQRSPQSPVLIFDTKGEPAFDSIATGSDKISILNSGFEFMKRWNYEEQPTYIIIRPTPEEMADQEYMDSILQHVYDVGRPCLVYIDEAYQWHVNGRCGAGLIGLLTRGRSKKMTLLLSTQRPAWVSRFCFSEATKFYVFRTTDKRDHKTLGEFVPEFDKQPHPAKFHWYFYNVGDDESLTYLRPVPLPEKRKILEGDNLPNDWI